ncbi:hypothetical protein Zm00014a_031641 [Zea mays]|uniref:Uncharacterized protein n=1 Tax=Zea mays TaxID=4577 RepID=A0A3L6EJZ1_MAIZE|nr:hypothetical protein Zm00014a_031641 [Zea mays]
MSSNFRLGQDFDFSKNNFGSGFSSFLRRY